MSKHHNYSQYANKNSGNREEVAPEILNPIETVEAIEAIEVETEPEVVQAPQSVKGIIIDCVKLNIRIAPHATATVTQVLPVNTELEIDMSKSTEDWYNICTASGIEGYCMKKFVKVAL